MKIGYACLAVAVPGSGIKSCTLKNADAARLLSLIGHNLDSLERLIDYNMQNGIRLFRISSDLIPFGSSLAAGLPWQEIFAEKLSAIGGKILRSGMRVSMHPGQYTVLNSPDALVAERAVEDLRYHTGVLDGLGLGGTHKIILHLGGVYGDKKQAKSRFLSRYQELEPGIQARLVLENDDKLFHIGDILETSAHAGIPVVYDHFHHAVNPVPSTRADFDWIRLCAETWKREDGPQKLHYSQQHPDRRQGAHSESIRIDPFLLFVQLLSGMDADIMLEVKDKNLSALKCINCVFDRGTEALEAEWDRYKYCVLERSPERYQIICRFLREKHADPALNFYRMLEEALALPVTVGNGVNAARHVWEHLSKKATEAEQRRFQTLLQKFTAGEVEIQKVKDHLLRLSSQYQEDSLLNGYYFYQ